MNVSMIVPKRITGTINETITGKDKKKHEKLPMIVGFIGCLKFL